MKRIVLIFISVLLFSYAYAQLNGDGYYRVRNVVTNRYLYVYDNTGSIQVATTSADMGAIQTWKDLNRAIPDPASVLYIRYVSSSSDGSKYYDIQSQGTGVYKIIGYYVNVFDNGDGTYYVYAEGKYLDDDETSNVPDGQLGTNRKTTRRWYVEPINTTTNYFGVKPTIAVNGKYYAPFYADFGFSFLNDDMKAYYVSRIENNIAIINDVNSTIVPNNVPLIIECGSSNFSDNKLNLSQLYSDVPSNNMLKGNYFNNEDRRQSPDARRPYDPQTMRVLGKTASGKLAYVKSTQAYLEANQSYLAVPAGTADELLVMTEEEFKISGINDVKVSTMKSAPVFSISGFKVSENNENIKNLPAGTYITDGKKIVIK